MENKSVLYDRLKSVLEQAVDQFPKNATLWTKYLGTLLVRKELALFEIDNDGGSEVDSHDPVGESVTPVLEIPPQFWKGVDQVGATDGAISLWETAVEHFVNLCQHNEELCPVVENLFNKSLAVEQPICGYFKPRFLAWISTRKGSA